jgi:Ca2+-binding RTX toxin-like protein
MAGVALAANVSGDGTLVGTTGNDTIAAANGNDTIWGLGGSDTITAGFGNDVIDAGGSCPAGLASGDYPNGLPTGDYCQHGPQPPCGTETISIDGGGQTGGNDVIDTNCGANTVSVSKGQGNDTVNAYGGPNNISLSNGNDTVFLFDTGTGGSSVTTGTGNDVVYAQNGVVDTITCGSKATVVFADRTDNVGSKCTVKFTPPPAADSVMRAHTRKHRTHKRRSRERHAAHKR